MRFCAMELALRSQRCGTCQCDLSYLLSINLKLNGFPFTINNTYVHILLIRLIVGNFAAVRGLIRPVIVDSPAMQFPVLPSSPRKRQRIIAGYICNIQRLMPQIQQLIAPPVNLIAAATAAAAAAAHLLDDDEAEHEAAAASLFEREYNYNAGHYRERIRNVVFTQALQDEKGPSSSGDPELLKPEKERWWNTQFWQKDFSVTREIFFFILDAIKDHLHQPEAIIHDPQAPVVTPAEQLAITLYYLARGGHYKGTGDAMGRSPSTVQRCVVAVTKVILRIMSPDVVVFPSTREELERTVSHCLNNYTTHCIFVRSCCVHTLPLLLKSNG